MKVKVRVFPNSKKSCVEIRDDGFLVVRVINSPKDNKANEEVINLLASYYNVDKKSVNIKHGEKNRSKLVEILA